MIRNGYTLYDIKAKYFSSPICYANDEEVKRAMSQMLLSKNEQNPYVRFPWDFQLFRIFSFDDLSAEIKLELKIEFVCELGSLIREEDQS